MTRRLPALLLCLGSVAAAVGLLAFGRRDAGDWALPLDDAYIHMAVARNLVESGSWGVNPGEFAAASSSPAWTAGLAALFTVVGPHLWVPVAVNLVALVLALVELERWFLAAGSTTWRRFVGLLAVSAGAALPVLAGLGMEHSAHVLAAVLLARAIVEGAGPARLAALGALLPLLRYEGLFEVAVGALVLTWGGRRREAGALAASAFAAVCAVGAWSSAQGAGFLPNSLLMKGSIGTGFATNLAVNLSEGRAAVALVALISAAAPFVSAPARRHAALFVGTAVLHLGLASVGWYYRYEAYLLAWGIAWVAAYGTLAGPRVVRFAQTALAAAALLFLATRTFDAVGYFQGRCVYIHDVKVTLGRRLAHMQPRPVLALHDIGAIAFYGRGTLVDIAGLGTDEVARLSSQRRFTGETIAEVAARRGATIAIATRSWMAADRPPGWVAVAELEWGLAADKRIEPLVLYALAPGADQAGVAWLSSAVADMGGRGRLVPVTPTTAPGSRGRPPAQSKIAR